MTEQEPIYTHTRMEDDSGNTISVRGPWSYVPQDESDTSGSLEVRFEDGMSQIDRRFDTIGELGYGDVVAMARKVLTEKLTSVYEMLRRRA